MSESVNEVDGMRRSDRRRRRTDWVEVEEGWMERGEDTAKWKRKRRKEEEGGERHHAGKEEKKCNDTIIKYKRWDTYYGDYGSFPYI